jgi:Domain of unknown function (DUF4138)
MKPKKQINMKKICVLGMLLCCLKSFCQVSIESYPLEVTYNKTTNIIFPFAVKSVDRGSKDVLVQKAKGDDHVLELKAGKANFQATNVSVITADGKLYSFMASYSAEPAVFNLSFQKDSVFLGQKRFLHISTSDEDMKLSLRSIYIQDRVLWFGFQLKNNSLIDFEPGYVKFFLQDKKKAKRTATQENELIPLNRVLVESIPGYDRREFVFAFKQFTIPKDKRLICQVSEQGGGRLLVLRIKHQTLLKARLPRL